MERRTRNAAAAWGIALLLLVAIEVAVFGLSGPWDTLAARIPGGGCGLENGITRDRMALRDLAQAPPAAVRTFVIGSSRACEGFRVGLLEADPTRGIVFTKLAHAAVTPVAIRSMVPLVEKSGAKAVAVLLSEFDTHSPLVLVPEASFGGVGVLADLGRLAGPRFVLENRTSFYRYAMSALLRSYRYRRVLGEAGLGKLREFQFQAETGEAGAGARLSSRAVTEAPARLGPDGPPALSREEFDKIRSEILASFPRKIPSSEFYQLSQLERGEHVAVQMGLLEASFARWRAAGIEVIVAEGPLNPIGAALYDPTLRDDFVVFAERMQRDYGVRFLPIDPAEPYGVEDFKDLTHLGPTGRVRLSRQIAAALKLAGGLSLSAEQ